MLRGIEEAKLKNATDQAVSSLVEKHMPLTLVTKMTQDARGRGKAIALARERARKDIMSHFILRLAYCRTEELRRWFMQQEMALLRVRLEHCGVEEYERFSAANNISFKNLSMDEKSDPDLVEAIRLVARKQGKESANISEYKKCVYHLCIHIHIYLHSSAVMQAPPLTDLSPPLLSRVPFVEALNLVARRAVVLRGGFAYVHREKLASSVLLKFRAHLSRSMADAARLFENSVQDPRIAPLLKNMNKQYIGKDFSKSANIENSLRFDQVG